MQLIELRDVKIKTILLIFYLELFYVGYFREKKKVRCFNMTKPEQMDAINYFVA